MKTTLPAITLSRMQIFGLGLYSSKNDDLAVSRYLNFGKDITKIRIMAHSICGSNLTTRIGDSSGKIIAKPNMPP